MKTKDSSVECQFDPRLTQLLFELDTVYRGWDSELTITSGSELSARHSRTSLHYNGCAADIRIWRNNNEPGPEAQLYELGLGTAIFCGATDIPRNWIDIILESNHIHIELQPKRP